MGTEVEIVGKTWREIALQWLVNQGVSTVLLFCILAGGGYLTYVMVPKHLETIQQGYERIDERHDTAIEKLAITHEKTVDRIITAITAERERTASHEPK